MNLRKSSRTLRLLVSPMQLVVGYLLRLWLVTAVTVDKVLPDPDSPQIQDIQTEEQMRAFIIANLTDNILYGAIAALLIFLIVVPWATQRRAKRQMKYDAMKRELEARRIKDAG